jgi:hypothetical protein
LADWLGGAHRPLAPTLPPRNQLSFQIGTQILRLKQDKLSWSAPKIGAADPLAHEVEIVDYH